jgi:hypothetical protein
MPVIVYHPQRHCYTVGIHDSLRCDQHITPVYGQSWEISGGTINNRYDFGNFSLNTAG